MFNNFIEMQEKVRKYLEVHDRSVSADYVDVREYYWSEAGLTLRGASGCEADPYDNSTDSFECIEVNVPIDFFENYDKYLKELKATRKAEADARAESAEKSREEYERSEYERLKAKFA